MYYAERVKHQIDECWRETYMKDFPNHDPGNPIPAMRFPGRNRVIGVIYKGETQEVKTAVRAEKAIMDAQVEQEQDGEDLNIVDVDAENAEHAEDAEDAEDAAGKQKRENVKKNQGYNRCVRLVHLHPS
jgi:hypothetical protein